MRRFVLEEAAGDKPTECRSATATDARGRDHRLTRLQPTVAKAVSWTRPFPGNIPGRCYM
ncbi:MAG: hypothetical protein CMF59_05755 [Leptospiraceae bacterium]|nr:hypothetical protein [Leptospiraceae bacterium]